MKKAEVFHYNSTPAKNHPVYAITIPELLRYIPQRLHTPHRVSFYALHLYTGGSGIHQVDFNNIAIKRGRMVFVSKGWVHNFDPAENYDGYALMFTEEFFCRTDFYRQFLQKMTLFSDPLQPPYFDTDDRFEELRMLFERIIAEQKEPMHNLQELMLHNYLVNMIVIADIKYKPLQKRLASPVNNLLTLRFKNLADKHLHEQWPVAYYAQQLNVTRRALESAFAKTERSTPKKWLMDRLMLEIKRRLTYEDLVIKEIADQLGFKEMTNFVKFFKKSTGTTPSAFRRSLNTPVNTGQ
ncbi:MAG TPA: helix-turn-helix transcriptional regulator [Niabella sp.]